VDFSGARGGFDGPGDASESRGGDEREKETGRISTCDGLWSDLLIAKKNYKKYIELHFNVY